MWFCKKETDVGLEYYKAFATFNAFRKVGEQFTYMGRPCVVTRHFYGNASVYARLSFDCLDKNGVIHQMSATTDDIYVLEQNPA